MDAAEALHGVGKGAKEAIPELIKVIHDKEMNVRYSVIGALGQIGPDA